MVVVVVVAVVAWLEAWMVAAGEAGVVVEEVVPMTLGPLWWPRALQGQGPDWSGFPAPRHPHLHCHHGPWVPVTPQGGTGVPLGGSGPSHVALLVCSPPGVLLDCTDGFVALTGYGMRVPRDALRGWCASESKGVGSVHGVQRCKGISDGRGDGGDGDGDD